MTSNGKTQAALPTQYRLHRPKNVSANGQPLRRQLLMFAEIETAPRNSWLVDGLLGAGEFSAVYGNPAAGKSVLVTDLAAHVAGGESWFGRKVQQGAVLLVCAEKGAVTQRRLAAIRKRHRWTRLPLGMI